MLTLRTLSVLLLPAAAQAAVAWVDLGPSDAASGVTNTQREQNTDGENDPSSCGPAGDARQGRTNRGAADDDVADAYLYFLVGDPAVKGSPALRISATFYDDPTFAGRLVRVRLQYTSAASSGPADLPNVFKQHPEPLSLVGSGKWVRRTWTIEDAGFRTFMQGTSDFRFVLAGERACLDRVEVAAIPPPVAAEEHLVGAHYYPWYTASRWSYAECVAGTLRLELKPAQTPTLGRYDSSSTTVVDQHLRWCAEYGVNVLILEFTSPGSREDQLCRNVILPHARSGDVRFTLLYDWAIRFGSFDLTQARINTARSDFQYLAQKYFPHRGYLKFRNEIPVVLIYVTRALQGDVDSLIAALREGCVAGGFEVFLVGDEFFFPSNPNATRIGRWDGIFGYDTYASQGGYWGQNGTLELFRQRSAAHRQTAASKGVKFFPSCAPGFNDRAIRRTCANHPTLSRRLTAESAPTSLFQELFRNLCLAQVDAEFPLIAITSFNEWHEDTQIEPTRGTAGTTSTDSSASGSAYTQGLEHDDYGLEFLESIRDATLAFSGKVLGPAGALAGATVEVLDGESAVLTRKSFTTGVYTVPRLRLTPGKSYRLKASFPGLSPVTSPPLAVEEGRALIGKDLQLGGPKLGRGDCNDDQAESVADPLALLAYLFRNAEPPPCLEACDLNADRALDLSDALYLLFHLFASGPAPRPPAFPDCGVVPSPLDCPGGNCA
jgi:hypothetical protein